MTHLKICCIKSVEEATAATKLGVQALGFVSEMPSGPGVLSLEEIAEILPHIPPHVRTFLLTSKTTVDEIVEQYHRCPTKVLQLTDQLTEGTIFELKAKLPAVSIVQVIHVVNEKSIAEAKEAETAGADMLLLDSGNPFLDIKELGGTGRTHDWSISRQIVQQVSVPVWLAGGLVADNVAEAIQHVQPYGVDVCSGVRSNNYLDAVKLFSFVRKVNPNL